MTGRSNNPWNLDMTLGGSSGGESAAIAAGMSPIGLGTDLAISVRGPAAQTGIVALKATHGRIPMTGIWPRAPRRLWHVGPMARSVRDLKLAYNILAGPDGKDGFSSVICGDVDLPQRQLRVGWLTGPGFGPIDPEVTAVVRASAEALRNARCAVEVVQIKALQDDFALDVFLKLHVNEMKPVFAETVVGHPDSDVFEIARGMLDTPDTSLQDFLAAEAAVDRLKDGFAEYFQEYDALLCPVLPRAAHDHGVKEVEIDTQLVDATYIMAATVPFNLTGLPALSISFGHSTEGLPINVQLVSRWCAETTILHLASLLEAVSPVKDRHPKI